MPQAARVVTDAPLLRPYQLEFIAAFEAAFEAGQRKILGVAPTGAGKTVIMAAIIARMVERHHRVVVISHRTEIVQQTRDKIVAAGLNPGVIQAGLEHELRLTAPTQVASIQTLWARAMRSKSMPLPPATVLIIDEAHHSRARTYEKIIAAYPDAILLGFTATPARGDGRGLGNVFDHMIECPQVAEMIVGGYRVKSRLYAPVDPDLKGVKVQGGDYLINQLAVRMNTAGLVGDIREHWFKHGEGRATVVFATDVGHSVAIKNEFVGAGVRAEHLDGSTLREDRDAILGRLRSGETQIVCNCMVLTEGFDCPDIGCIILARPTKQLPLFRQMIGRGLRPAPGKTDLVILDHSGAVRAHGLPEDHVEWTLNVDRRAENPAHVRRKAGIEPQLRDCPSCKAIMVKPPCGACGWMPQPKARNIEFEDGQLGLVLGGKTRAQAYTVEEKIAWHGMLIGEALRRGKNPNWAFYLFRDKFGHDRPGHWDRTALAPTPEVINYVRSRVIAYAKARAAA
jgi:DNA repair protein RadD